MHQDPFFRYACWLKFWETLLFGCVAEFTGDEAFHANSLSGVDNVDLVQDALHANSADDSILTTEGILKARDGIIGLNDLDAIWKFGLGGGTGEDRDGEIGSD
jgi:hypothetical protein